MMSFDDIRILVVRRANDPISCWNHLEAILKSCWNLVEAVVVSGLPVTSSWGLWCWLSLLRLPLQRGFSLLVPGWCPIIDHLWLVKTLRLKFVSSPGKLFCQTCSFFSFFFLLLVFLFLTLIYYIFFQLFVLLFFPFFTRFSFLHTRFFHFSVPWLSPLLYLLELTWAMGQSRF
jgi:hypothetical protein